jgi:CHAD domain-containing protein
MLREHVTALEAAITVCLSDPRPRTVHRLRTMTRRIEGQFALLAAVPGVPKHEILADKTRRDLKKIRRAAGSVRDLDVQMDLIDSVRSTSRSKPLRDDSSRLRAALEELRKDNANQLRKLLRHRGVNLARRMEKLLDALQPVESLSLSPTELAALAREWFQKNTPAKPAGSHDDPGYLHAVRRKAKLARYISENAPKTAVSARRLASAFEKLQQAGGEWHDWLILAAEADDTLGSSSPLTKEFTRRCRLSLTAYKRRLSRGIA